MQKTLPIVAALLLVAVCCAGPVQAQFMANVGLTSESVMPESSQSHGSLSQYAAIAMLPTLNYAQTHGMPALAESMQDMQYIGFGLAYGSEVEKLGLQLMYLYFISAKLGLGGDITFFLPDKFNGFGIETKANWLAFNVLARYILYQTATLHAYAMGGLNLSVVRVKVEGLGQSQSNSDSELGLNVGGGLAYALGFAALYAELSYVFGNADQLVLAAGLRFALGGR